MSSNHVITSTEIGQIAGRLAAKAASLGAPIMPEGRPSVHAIDGQPYLLMLSFRPYPQTRVGSVLGIRADLSGVTGRPGSVRVQWDADAGLVRVQCPLGPIPEFTQDKLADMIEKSGKPVPSMHAMLGLTVHGKPLVIDMDSARAAHVGIFGQTQCGKTTLAQGIVSSVCRTTRPLDLQVFLLDHKRDDVFARSIPGHLAEHAKTAAECVQVLERAVALMRNRAGQPKPGPTDPQWTRILVYCDELADLCRVGGRRVTEGFEAIARMGGGLRVGMVICTQHPSASEIAPVIKQQLPARFVGRVADAATAVLCSGKRQTGAETLRGRGDFLLIRHDADDIRFQAARFEPLRDSSDSKSQESVTTGASPIIKNDHLKLLPPAGGTGERDADTVERDAVREMADVMLGILRGSMNPRDMSNNELCRRCDFKDSQGRQIVRVVGNVFHRRFVAARQLAEGEL